MVDPLDFLAPVDFEPWLDCGAFVCLPDFFEAEDFEGAASRDDGVFPGCFVFGARDDGFFVISLVVGVTSRDICISEEAFLAGSASRDGWFVVVG